MTKERAAQLRSDLRKARDAGCTNDWRLAELLWLVTQDTVGPNKMPVWKHFGFKSWAEYVEQELGMDYSRARRFRRTWWAFEVKLGKKWDHSLMLPMSKMTLVARIATAKNVEELLKLGGTMTVGGLREHVVRRSYEERGIEKSVLTKIYYDFHAQMTAKEMHEVERALTKARAETDSKRRGSLLAHIAHAWLGDGAAAQNKGKKQKAA